MTLLKTQNPDLYRDEQTNAVINTNVAAFKLYKQQRESRNTIDDLRNEVDELKALVKELIKKQT